MIILVFVSLVLVVGAVLLFLQRLRAGDFDHGERLSLLPLAEDAPSPAPAPAAGPAGPVAATGGKEDGEPHASR